MSRFKPQVQVVTRESLREHRDSYYKKPMQEVHSFNTYTELKKKIKDFCERCIEEEGVFENKNPGPFKTGILIRW